MYYIKINDANDSDWFWVEDEDGRPGRRRSSPARS